MYETDAFFSKVFFLVIKTFNVYFMNNIYSKFVYVFAYLCLIIKKLSRQHLHLKLHVLKMNCTL